MTHTHRSMCICKHNTTHKTTTYIHTHVENIHNCTTTYTPHTHRHSQHHAHTTTTHIDTHKHAHTHQHTHTTTYTHNNNTHIRTNTPVACYSARCCTSLLCTVFFLSIVLPCTTSFRTTLHFSVLSRSTRLCTALQGTIP
jgi:hypothetical protein